MPNVATASPSASPSASPAVLASGETTPRFLDTYALVYAFSLLWLVPAIVALASLPKYSYSNAYAALVALPPVLGMASVLLTDPVRPAWRSFLLRTVVLVSLSVAGSVAVMFVAVLFVPVVAGMLAPHLGAFGVFSVVSLLVVSSPMLLVLPRTVRARQWLRVAALVAAIGAIAVVVVLTIAPTKTLGTALRQDQISFLIGGLTWYLPAYGLCGALCRVLGLG